MQQLFQSAFLQALGKAIANSIWQIGLLYLLYHLVVFLFRIKQSTVKNFFSTVLSLTGFAWFLYTIGSLWNNQLLQKTSLVITDAGSHSSLLNSFTNDNRWELFFNWLDYKIQFILPYLSAAYLFVLLWFAAKLIIQVQAANALRNKGLTEVEDEIKEFFSFLVETMGLQRSVQLYFSKQIDIPATIGFFKPIVLLPATAVTHLTAAQLEAVLLHELAHIKRNDYFWNMLLSVSETMLFFNPFALLLIGIARKERENSCDDYVMNYQQNAAVYAEALLNVEKARIQNPQLAMALGDNKHHLKDRIKRILNLPAEKNKISSRLLALVLFTVVFALTGWMLKEHKPAVQLSERRTVAALPSKQTANTTYYLTTEVVEKKTKDEVVLHDEERKYRLQLHPKTKMEKIVLWDELENEELRFDKVIINDMPVEWFERIVKPGTKQPVEKPVQPERGDVFLFRYKHDSAQYAQQEKEMHLYFENGERTTREAPRRKMPSVRVLPQHYSAYTKNFHTDSLLKKINIQWPEGFAFQQFPVDEFVQRFLPMEEGVFFQRLQQGSDEVKKERMKTKVNVMRKPRKEVDSTLAEEELRYRTNRSAALAVLHNKKAIRDEIKRAQQHFEIIVENDVLFLQGPPPSCNCPTDSIPQQGQQMNMPPQPKRIVIKKLEVIRL
jgi:beta-lactamase regulating signal transducer with metallopeptidase domain